MKFAAASVESAAALNESTRDTVVVAPAEVITVSVLMPRAADAVIRGIAERAEERRMIRPWLRFSRARMTCVP